MKNTKHEGSLVELQCITYLFSLGYDISIPFGDNSRYDFVIDINNKLYRVQCKKSHLEEEGVYKFNCCNVGANASGYYKKVYTEEQIDFYSTFVEGKCYLVPIQETSKRSKTLRFVPPKNNQIKGITFASEYEAKKQIEKLL